MSELLERATSAANYLNSGQKWRCHNATSDYPDGRCCGEPGVWLIYRKPLTPTFATNATFLSHEELLEHAREEGWEG